jgi:flagellar biosynthesis/type III secretory pathway chaperone
MEKMEGKTESLEMVNENSGRLLNELDSLINKLQISYEHQVSVLYDPDGQ